MPIHRVSDFTHLGSEASPDLRRISIPELTHSSDCMHRTVQGRVVQKGPVLSCLQRDHLLKAVIQEDDAQQTSASHHVAINVIFFGPLSKDFSKSVNQGDFVLLAGFTIRRSPSEQADRLHPCHLEMSTDSLVYVCSSDASVVAASAALRSECRYKYVPLNQLKPNSIVNVYGLVTFFKQPFPTKGTDYCSTLKITDQSNAKVGCTIFSENLDDHPKIFRMGDIIRLHRVKVQLFNGSMTLLTTLGWSSVMFDGVIDSPVEPRTSSRTFHFDDADKHTVMELRQWAASQMLYVSEPTVPLSSVQPRMYFDLTCQLLAKACIDSQCTLLKVWDGTKCAHPLLNVAVASEALEGECTSNQDRENMTANVLVYDNHVEVAKKIQPGMFLRLYNLHAVPQRHEQLADLPNPLGFHLHGGTSYGRGLRILPSDSSELQPLKSLLQSHVESASANDVNDATLLEAWYTPPENVGVSSTDNFYTVRTCDHNLPQMRLAQVRELTPPGVCHARARVKSYQPQKLYQSLKLFCSQCKTIAEVPNDELLSQLFEDARSISHPCSEHWAVSSSLDHPHTDHTISMHVSCDMVLNNTQSNLLFIQGVTLSEMCVISAAHHMVVPVHSEQGRMKLLDLSAPFLFCGDKRYYGCKRCSRTMVVEPEVAGVEVWDEQNVAKVLGVQLMQYMLLFKLELEDESASLNAVIWEDAERFFHVTAADTSSCQEAQDRVQTIMDRVLPPGSIMASRPWLDFCLRAYTVQEEGRAQVCYQIINTETRGTFISTH